MDSHHLRAVILKIQDSLSDNDRRRLHFFLGNDVPKRIRDDSSLSGTLSLMESLIDQDKINEQDFTLLINAFNEIQCTDAVKVLKKHMNRMETTGQKLSGQNLLAMLFRDLDDDKLKTNSSLINQKSNYANYNTIVHAENIAVNPVTINTNELSRTSRQKCLFELSSIRTIFILVFIFMSIIGLAVSTSIYVLKFIANKEILKDMKKNISAEQADNHNLTEIVKQLNNELIDYKRLVNQIKFRYGDHYGGDGGGRFNDAIDLQLSPTAYCTGVEVFCRSQLVAIRFIYEQDNSSTSKIYHGSDTYWKEDDTPLSNKTFLLSKKEQINKVILYTGKGNGTHEFKVMNTPVAHVMGIQFSTTLNQLSPLYGTNDGEKFTESFEGFTLGYATGRAGVIIDMLQFVWYKQVMIRNGTSHGGDGGGPFDDSNDLQLLPMTPCIGIQAFWGNRLVALQFMYRQDLSSILNASHGFYGMPSTVKPPFENDTFLLSNNEQFNKVILYVANASGEDIGLPKNETYRYVVGVKFYTTGGRSSSLYGASEGDKFNESYDGFIFGYATGHSGGLIDRLQFVWYEIDSSSKVHDGLWMENENGQVPQNAIVGGYENQQCVYIVRGDFGTNCVPGKLIKTRNRAEIIYASDITNMANYQVLINPDSTRNFTWEIVNDSTLPKGAFVAGKEGNATLYVGRLNISNSSFLGKYNEIYKKFYYTHEESIHDIDTGFEVLCRS